MCHCPGVQSPLVGIWSAAGYACRRYNEPSCIGLFFRLLKYFSWKTVDNSSYWSSYMKPSLVWWSSFWKAFSDWRFHLRLCVAQCVSNFLLNFFNWSSGKFSCNEWNIAKYRQTRVQSIWKNCVLVISIRLRYANYRFESSQSWIW